MTKKYDAILDAALEGFASKGFDGASLRDIAKVAGVAQPTINYHFKTKDALFAAIVERGALKSTTIRREALAEARKTPATLTLERIMSILLETYNRPASQTPTEERQFNKFIARYGYGDSDAAREMVLRAFEDMAVDFIAAIVSLDEGFDELSATRAYFFALPSGIHAIDYKDRIPRLLDLAPDAPEAQHSLDHVIEFVCAGMRTMARS